MSTVATASIQIATREHSASPPTSETVSVALLGLGNVGNAVARLAARSAEPRFTLAGALVRDTGRPRTVGVAAGIPATTNPEALLDARPDALVEVLGGLEPARAIVLQALSRGIPVVTANKALVAAHGEELVAAAADAGVPLRYEATVIAGVPFLGTFARRPFARGISSITGVVNGTSNFILSTIAEDGASYDAALGRAQSLGLAEPDPAKDVRGVDAAEKLCILLRHFAALSVRPSHIETSGIDQITSADLQQAEAAGGTIKPVVHARWDGASAVAFVGPAFVPARHPLAAVHGVTNGIVLGGRQSGDLFYSGPGAGPAVTAATILDDVIEAVAERRAGRRRLGRPAWKSVLPTAPETGWFVRLSGPSLPPATDVADLLAAHGLWLQRTSETAVADGGRTRWSWTYPCAMPRIDRALLALSAACGCSTLRVRALEAAA
jgi:homoserine dehydrogenase